MSRCAHWCVPPTCHKFCWITPVIFTIRRWNTGHFSQLLSPRCSPGTKTTETLSKVVSLKQQAQKRDWKIPLHSFTPAQRYYEFINFRVFFIPSLSVFGTTDHQGSLGQWLPEMRILWLPDADERCWGKTDDRNRQTATFGQTAAKRETKHHSGGASSCAPHSIAQTALGTRETGWNTWTRKQRAKERSRLWNSELCGYT